MAVQLINRLFKNYFNGGNSNDEAYSKACRKPGRLYKLTEL